MNRKEHRIGESNRDVKRRKKGNGFWCPVCDTMIVSPGQRCKGCGKRALPIRDKK